MKKVLIGASVLAGAVGLALGAFVAIAVIAIHDDDLRRRNLK